MTTTMSTRPGRWRRFAAALLAGVALSALAAGPARAAAFDVRTFRPWAGYAIPNGQWLAADLNADGRKDLVHLVQGRDYVHTWTANGDGTYAVGTFRPWAGYTMPNGLWHVADLNGDGRQDLVHVVQGVDYVHTWISNGNGTFAVGTFRPWAGYAMPNGQWHVADLNGDGRADLVHLVQGKDYAHTWTSNGDGTFSVGTFRPWAGYAMPNGLWHVADLNGDGRGDLVHLVQGADYAHTWISNGNGTFAVGTFRPWAGYAMPNGEWRVLDFDGDRRADLVHLVQGRDYAHTWRSNGDGTFAVGTFRPWAGYAMPNGVWLTGDLDADGRDDLFHAVQARDYAHTWLSNGNGTFRVGTFSPWAGYAIPNGLWFAGDHNGDGKADIVHAVQARDYAHPWISNLPRPGEFMVEGLEVTQAVQDMQHTVPLVAGKATVARAYLGLNGAAPRNVTGEISIWRAGSTTPTVIGSLGAAAVDPAANGDLRAKREDAARSLNFPLPAGLAGAGNLVVRVTRLRDAATGADLPCADCASSPRAVALVASAPLRLRVLGLRYSSGSPSATYAPVARDFALLRSWLGRAYPVGQVQMSSVTVQANAAAPFGCGDANAQSAAVRAADVANGTDARTHYYAMVFDDADPRSFFMRGCSAGIPGAPSPGTVASGPTGAADWGWDNDGSYGDWYGGHELGHTVGRLHIGSGCGESSDDPSYPYPAGQITGNDGRHVGFDTGDAANGIPMRALPGTVWRDVMSYCANQWISDYTYTRVRDRLNGEDALPAGPAAVPVAAGPAYAPEALAGPAPSLAGPPEVRPGGTSPPVQEAGEGALAVMVAPAYAGPSLPEPALAAAPATPEPARAGGAPEPEVGAAGPPLPPEEGGALRPPASSSASPAAEAAAATATVVPAREVRQGDLLSVVGTVNVTRREGDIGYVRRVPQGLVTLGQPDRTAELRLLDASGRVIATHPAPFLPNSEREPGEDLIGIVDAVVPFAPGAASVELAVEGEVVDRFEAAAPGARGPVAVSVAPAAGAAEALSGVPAGGSYELDWSAAGQAPGNASYDVQASADDGRSWQTVAIGLTEPRATVDLSGYGREGTVTVRVVANDGFSTAVLDTATVDLARR